MTSKLLEKLRARVKEKIGKKAEQQKGWGLFNVPESIEFFRPQKPGTYHIDILPYKVSVNTHPQVSAGEIWFERTIFIHFGIGDEQLAYICPKTIGKRCPICEQRAKLMKDPNADEELIRQLKPRERQLFNVIDLDDPEKKIKIWEVSSFLFGEMLEEEIRNGDEENASFFFYEGGKTLKVRMKQESFGDNTFLKAHRIDFEDREDYGEDILNDTVDLDKTLVILSYEELEKKFLGLNGDEHPTVVNAENKNEKEDDNISFEPEKLKKKDDDISFEPEKLDEKTQTQSPISTPIHSPKPKSEETNRCPAGGKFGEDCNELKECDNCEIWDACQDKKDEINASKRRRRN